MKSSISRFLIELFVKPVYVLVSILVSFAGLLTLFASGLLFKSWFDKSIALLFLAVLILVVVVIKSYKFYMHSLAKLKIRLITLDEYRVGKPPIIIFERRHWMLMDQLFILSVSLESHDSPLCLLRVEAFTDEKEYPQGVVVEQLTPKDLEKFILDEAHWKSLKVSSAIQWRHIPERKNE